MPIWLRAVSVTVFMTFCTPAATAGDGPATKAVTDAVPGHPGLTYEALLRLFIPHMDQAGRGAWVTPGIAGLRGIDGETLDETSFSFTTLQTLSFDDEGRRILLVLLIGDTADGIFSAPLAAYDMSDATPKLIDFVDAGLDRGTTLGATLALSDAARGFTIRGAHHNSSESYELVQLAMLQDEAIVPVLRQMTYSVQACAWEMTQTLSLEARPDAPTAWRAIVVSVTEKVALTGADCGDSGEAVRESGERVLIDIFRWDADTNAYASATDHLSELTGPE